MRTRISLLGAALALSSLVVLIAPAYANGLPSMALGTGLAAAKATRLAGNDAARLICSDGTETVTMNAMQFSASALGNGIDGETSCRWFVAGGASWTEADGKLADVAAHVALNFVVPAPGKEPLLYEVIGDAAPEDYPAAIASITASYGAPQSSGKSGASVETVWQTDKLKIILTQKDNYSGMMEIDYLDNALEQIALGLL